MPFAALFRPRVVIRFNTRFIATFLAKNVALPTMRFVIEFLFARFCFALSAHKRQ